MPHPRRSSARSPDRDRRGHASVPARRSAEQEMRANRSMPAPPLLSAALRHDPRLGGRGNAVQRIATLQHLQRTVGNRAVRRLVRRPSGPTALPAQVPAPLREASDPLPSAAAIQRLWTRGQFQSHSKGSGLSRRHALITAMDGQLAWYHNPKQGGRATTKIKIGHLEYLHGLTDRWLRLKQAKVNSGRKAGISTLKGQVETELEGLYTARTQEESQLTNPNEFDIPYNPPHIKDMNALFTDRHGNAGPQASDIIQGDIGDCFFLAALLALVQKDSAYLRNMFRMDTPGTQKFEDDAYITTPAVVSIKFWRKTKVNEYQPQWIQVNVQRGAHAVDLNSAPWVLAIERAYATFRGSYAAIDGGKPHDVLEAFYGDRVAKSAHKFEKFTSTHKSVKLNIDDVKTRLAKGYLVTIGTDSSEGGDQDQVRLDSGERISLQHAYNVSAVKGNNLVLQDPHGSKTEEGTGEHEITARDFTRFFGAIYYVKLQG